MAVEAFESVHPDKEDKILHLEIYAGTIIEGLSRFLLKNERGDALEYALNLAERLSAFALNPKDWNSLFSKEYHELERALMLDPIYTRETLYNSASLEGYYAVVDDKNFYKRLHRDIQRIREAEDIEGVKRSVESLRNLFFNIKKHCKRDSKSCSE